MIVKCGKRRSSRGKIKQVIAMLEQLVIMKWWNITLLVQKKRFRCRKRYKLLGCDKCKPRQGVILTFQTSNVPEDQSGPLAARRIVGRAGVYSSP